MLKNLQQVVIGARQSHLARLQAFHVGLEIKKLCPHVEIQYIFKKSLGDIQDNQSLYKMPEKGVFTEDFVKDLLSGTVDVVVHSWKDLPTQRSPETEVVGTLPREDSRDLLLIPKSVVKKWNKLEVFRVLSSSPRRVYNLESFLSWALPQPSPRLVFEDVRGNIPTRLKRLFVDAKGEGLVVAKAALDRLLSFNHPEFVEVQKEMRSYLKEAFWMVLPLSQNPTAAAQGALAIEIAAKRQDLKELFKSLNCEKTFADVSKEREILSSYGGGCHQKIGISIRRYPFGTVKSMKGLTDAGQVLDEWSLQTSGLFSASWFEGGRLPQNENFIWPQQPKEGTLLRRKLIEVDLDTSKGFYLSRAEALPTGAESNPPAAIWVSGLKSWRQLSERGYWVNGCQESLGDFDPSVLNSLCPDIEWVKLSHQDAALYKQEASVEKIPVVATYKLEVDESLSPDFSKKTHFYWMSASSFARAVKLCPSILSAYHACGPGATYHYLSKVLPQPELQLRVFLDYEHWRKIVLAKPTIS